MAISESEARVLAGRLPEGLSCTNARERLLCLVEVLCTLTDPEHPLSNADIRAVLAARFGEACAPAENTIASDLRAIARSGALGLEVHTTPRGVWSGRTRLTPARVRLLLNATQSSRFLTNRQSEGLQADLLGLVSCHQRDALMGQVHVDQRVHREPKAVFGTLEAVTRAINAGKKIEFSYTYSGYDGKPHVLRGDGGEALRVETPIALYYSEGNYYVETFTTTPWRHGIRTMVSRADRMMGTCVSAERQDECDEVWQARASAQRRMEEAFDMVGGPLRRIFLRVRADRTNVVFDRLGFGLGFGQFEGERGAPDSSGITLVRVPQVFTFFRWLASTGDGVVMVRPPDELGLRTGPWVKRLRGVSRDELVRDYEEMVAAFLAYLDRARSPYVDALGSAGDSSRK